MKPISPLFALQCKINIVPLVFGDIHEPQQALLSFSKEIMDLTDDVDYNRIGMIYPLFYELQG